MSNYRPITLLNSDYKLYTKILALKMTPLACYVIHPNQAAFLPGRHIEDQTRLCQTMIHYCEATEENGALIALDQEKAYDRIAHDYLWETLKEAGIPPRFISKLRRLYQKARTKVIINEECSPFFSVTRGVRQGDPLSCILFLLAIELLACMLRASTLHGFSIPGMSDRILASLFADDTSVFLSQHDTWPEVWIILNKWCEASKAKFNNFKTAWKPAPSTSFDQLH